MRAPEGKCEKSLWGGYPFRFPREEEKTRTRAVGFLKSPEIPLEGLIKIPLERLIKIPLEGNFFRFPRESEKTRTRAVGFLKTPEIPLEGNFFRFPREAEKSRTKAVRFLKSTEIPLEGLIFHPLHVADWPRVKLSVSYFVSVFSWKVSHFPSIMYYYISSVRAMCFTYLFIFVLYSLRTSTMGGGGCCQTFPFGSLFPVQQTTSGIGHRVK